MSEKKKRSTDLVSNQCQDKINLNTIISALITCANKAIVRNKRNHMNNQTSGKCHASETSSISKTKVSFVFCSTKDLQEIPLAN